MYGPQQKKTLVNDPFFSKFLAILICLTYVHKMIVVFRSIIKPKSKCHCIDLPLENPEIIEKSQEKKPGENLYKIESRLKIKKKIRLAEHRVELH